METPPLADERADRSSATEAIAGAVAKKPRFQKYFIIRQTGKEPVVAELVRVRRGTPDEKLAAFDTGIKISPELGRRMFRDSGLENQVMDFASPLGAEIGKTSIIRFQLTPDDPNGEPLKARFRFKLGGTVCKEDISMDDVPDAVLSIVTAALGEDEGDGYASHPDYLRWYWRYVSQRRDAIVSGEIRKRFEPEAEPAPA